MMLGKTIGMIATSSNLALRGIATVLQAGGIALAAAQITQISTKYAEAFAKTAPALWELSKDPNARTFEKTKHLVEQEFGPPIADTALFAAGLAAGHAADRILGKISLKKTSELQLHPAPEGSLAGSGRFWETIDEMDVSSEIVVKQCHPRACVAAVGSMLSGKTLSQEIVRARLEKNWGEEYLATHPEPELALMWLPEVLGDKEWIYNTYDTSTVKNVRALLIGLPSPFGAVFKKFGTPHHAVVIDGLEENAVVVKGADGKFREMKNLVNVRDPEGKTYKMTIEELQSVWNGETVRRK